MKETDICKDRELESIKSELFNSFDPQDESWIVGGTTKTITGGPTGTPMNPDAWMDMDIVFANE
jgi:hypothetical protein